MDGWSDQGVHGRRHAIRLMNACMWAGEERSRWMQRQRRWEWEGGRRRRRLVKWRVEWSVVRAAECGRSARNALFMPAPRTYSTCTITSNFYTSTSTLNPNPSLRSFSPSIHWFWLVSIWHQYTSSPISSLLLLAAFPLQRYALPVPGCGRAN